MRHQKQSPTIDRVLTRKSLVTCFSQFSHAWERLHISPRLGAVTYFPLFDTRYMFPRVWQQPRLPAHVNGFPRLFWPPHLCGLLHYLKPLETILSLVVSSRKAETTSIAGSFHSSIIYFLSRRKRDRHRADD